MNEGVFVPPSALVVLIGAAGSGKSTFAQKHFPIEAIVASDAIRREPHGRRRNDVFDELHAQVRRRLEAGQLTVVDATNTDWMRRSELIRSARQFKRPAVAIVFALPLESCLAHNAARPEAVPRHTVKRQSEAIARDLDRLDLEGFSPVYTFHSAQEAATATVEIERGPVSRASAW